jgi:hypothetical protein
MLARVKRDVHLARALVALGCALLVSGPLWDRDWGFHLATFERTVEERRLPRDDVFSYTAERPYEPVHLLFQVAAGLSVRALGLDGLWLLRLGASVTIGLALHGALRRRGAGPWAAAALTLLVQAGGAYRLVERPHLATTLGLVLLLDALLAWRDRGLERPWRLVPLLWAWACTHPGVVFGVLTMWGFLTVEALRGRSARSLAGVLVVATLATLANPLGPELYPYLLRQDEVRDLSIRELAPVWSAAAWPSRLAIGLLALGALLALRRRALDPTLGGACLAFAALGIYINRELPLALIVLALLLAPRVRGRSCAAFALALVPVAIVAGRQVERAVTLGRVDATVYPITAADWLERHRPQGRLWNSNGVGSYLEWRLWRHGVQVYSDGRIPLFARALVDEKGDFRRVEERWRLEVLVVDFAHRQDQVPPAEATPDFQARWALVHVAGAAKVYLRRGGPNDALIERFGYRQLAFFGRHAVRRAEGFDAATLAAEIARARAADPWAARWLPP